MLETSVSRPEASNLKSLKLDCHLDFAPQSARMAIAGN
jgi:hypothetical protein